ncbi:hypothetical protein IQ268_08865 [Oculatella sp. LEGE 06141]|uniref:CIS tube protein n=1 Tax=Oculatella sp. LEGE 06141 TaxID=1828648 RepID=UPI001882A5E9|nr:hypothetical protein [Oculatella sp. LEGE 06141]MBE9178669.1 hypothetical protein [Oculatella sp. LEGE 06141]
MTSFNNPAVLGELPEVPKSGDRIWASLILESQLTGTGQGEQTSFTFLANPEELNFDQQAVYSKATAAATNVQDQQWYYTDGETLQLNDLLLETWFARRSLQPIINKLRSLLSRDYQSQNLNPPVLYFVWGSRQFGPCVLTSIKRRESAWLSDGQPASIRLSLTLVEIPKERPPSRPEPEGDGEKLASPLTDRQLEEAGAEARNWLQANLSKLPAALQDRIRASRYRFSSDRETGAVRITDEQGEAIGTVGTWDGRTFDVSEQSLD